MAETKIMHSVLTTLWQMLLLVLWYFAMVFCNGLKQLDVNIFALQVL